MHHLACLPIIFFCLLLPHSNFASPSSSNFVGRSKNERSTNGSTPNPTPRKYLFDDLATAGWHVLRSDFPNSQIYDVQGNIQNSGTTSSLDPSDFRRLTLMAWDPKQQIEISLSNKQIDARIFNKPKVYVPGPELKEITTFSWRDRRTILADAFDILKKKGKLERVRQVNIQSLQKPSGAPESGQPYYIFEFEDVLLDPIWLGAWDQKMYRPPDPTTVETSKE